MRSQFDTIEVSPNMSEETMRICPIVSEQTWQDVHELMRGGSLRTATNEISAAILGGRTQQFARTQAETKPRGWGYDPETNTITVLDPSILPPGHKPIVKDPNTIYQSYDRLFDFVLRDNPYCRRVIENYDRNKDYATAVRTLLGSYTYVVMLTHTPMYFPDGRMYAVKVPVGPGGMWDRSPRGELIYVPQNELSNAAVRSYREDHPAAPLLTSDNQGMTRVKPAKASCASMLGQRFI